MNVISEPKNIPTPKEAANLVAQLEQNLRYNPDSTTADGDILAIVRAYADGKLVRASKG